MSRPHRTNGSPTFLNSPQSLTHHLQAYLQCAGRVLARRQSAQRPLEVHPVYPSTGAPRRTQTIPFPAASGGNSKNPPPVRNIICSSLEFFPLNVMRLTPLSRLQIFLPRRLECGFILHLPRFQARLRLPPSDPNTPHPALLNALYLLGCLFSPPELNLEPREPDFLSSTRKYLSSALSQTDRLLDFLMASCLLAWYLAARGRLTESTQVILGAARLAVACGLHKISSRVRGKAGEDGSSQLLGPTKEGSDLGERTYTFWTIFSLDRFISMVTELPGAFRDDVSPFFHPFSCRTMKIELLFV